jgi:hypothetical protein
MERGRNPDGQAPAPQAQRRAQSVLGELLIDRVRGAVDDELASNEAKSAMKPDYAGLRDYGDGLRWITDYGLR